MKKSIFTAVLILLLTMAVNSQTAQQSGIVDLFVNEITMDLTGSVITISGDQETSDKVYASTIECGEYSTFYQVSSVVSRTLRGYSDVTIVRSWKRDESGEWSGMLFQVEDINGLYFALYYPDTNRLVIGIVWE